MANIKEALRLGRDQLQHLKDMSAFEAELLLTHVLDKPRSHLFTWPEEILPDAVLKDYAALIHARAEGQPIAYLTGQREFWSIPLKVSPATLIPRPETETLVEQALARIPDNETWQLLDLGTGSGAIAIALSQERPRCEITATDISASALAIAKDNAVTLSAQIRFIEGEWFNAVPGQTFNLIISNPPYIPASDPHLTQGDVRFEPASALVAGEDGLDAYRAIISAAADHLENEGWILFEHGYNQVNDIRKLFELYDFKEISSHKDAAERTRVTAAQYIR